MKHPPKKRGRPPKVHPLAKSPHLHLSHRRHSFKLLPHRSTSYPLLAMMLLCVGVLLSSWTHLVSADSYDVQASVPGLPPASAATIVTPVAGAHLSVTPVTISGSCPINSYVSLYRTDVFSGVGQCSAAGSYSITTDLFVGANQLQARVFSKTDLPGPVVAPTIIYYDPPAGPASSGISSGSRADNVPPTQTLVLTSTFLFKGHYAGDPLAYQLLLTGGQGPYAIAVEWGDGQRSLVSRSGGGSFELTHTYQNAATAQNGYPVSVTATDANGQQTNLQLLSIITVKPGAAVGPSSATGGSGQDLIQRALRFIVPMYASAVLTVVAFWLGERYEFSHLRHTHRLRHV
ncbi:MAG: hypothetical protein ABI602_04110 [Candidatus Saccharibacteria bacterium]